MDSIRPSAIPVREAAWPRERFTMLAGIAAVVLAGWAYLAYEAWRMAAMGASGMHEHVPRSWHGVDLMLVFGMWAIMMAAMMLPGATPTLLLFARVQEKQTGGHLIRAWVFASGYVAMWTVFSIGATVAQWALHRAALLSPMMLLSNRALAGAVLLGAGIYQFTPFKQACLRHCQSPLGFLLSRWRDGRGGAFAMGFSHGAYCVGCCWALMAILFALGVMNLAAAAALALFVAAEKLVPGLRHPAGIALICWGAWLLAALVF
jgi:predicted metal-binding membrane protein